MDFIRGIRGMLVNVTDKCVIGQPQWITPEFGSPLFVWELLLDVVLAVILVAFLNYQVSFWSAWTTK